MSKDFESQVFQLTVLIVEGLLSHFGKHVDLCKDANNLHDPALLSVFPQEQAYILVNSILSTLGTKSKLSTPDVFSLVLDEFLAQLSEGPELDETALTTRIIRRLRSPVREYKFTILIGARSPIGIDIDIGGEHELKLSTATPGASLSGSELSGRVNAVDEWNAMAVIERDIKYLLGLSIALGVAEPLFAPIYSLPKVVLKDCLEPEIPLSPTVGGLARRTIFGLPHDRSELENDLLASGDSLDALTRRFGRLAGLLIDESERGKELRNAAALLFDAHATSDAGMAISIAFMSMESVLLDPKARESIVARLSEAAAYRLGKSSQERQDIRRRITKLYEVRSRFVHTGTVPHTFPASYEALRLASLILGREVLDLECGAILPETFRVWMLCK